MRIHMMAHTSKVRKGAPDPGGCCWATLYRAEVSWGSAANRWRLDHVLIQAKPLKCQSAHPNFILATWDCTSSCIISLSVHVWLRSAWRWCSTPTAHACCRTLRLWQAWWWGKDTGLNYRLPLGIFRQTLVTVSTDTSQDSAWRAIRLNKGVPNAVGEV